MWLANPHSILQRGFSLSRAKAVFIPPAKLVVVARSSYPTTKKALSVMLCKAMMERAFFLKRKRGADLIAALGLHNTVFLGHDTSGTKGVENGL